MRQGTRMTPPGRAWRRSYDLIEGPECTPLCVREHVHTYMYIVFVYMHVLRVCHIYMYIYTDFSEPAYWYNTCMHKMTVPLFMLLEYNSVDVVKCTYNLCCMCCTCVCTCRHFNMHTCMYIVHVHTLRGMKDSGL